MDTSRSPPERPGSFHTPAVLPRNDRNGFIFFACSVDRKGFSLSDTKQTCPRSDANCLRLGDCKATRLSDLIEDFEGGPLKLTLGEHETEGNTDGKGLLRGGFTHFEQWMNRVRPILSKWRRDFLQNRQGSILL